MDKQEKMFYIKKQMLVDDILNRLRMINESYNKDKLIEELRFLELSIDINRKLLENEED